MLRSPIINATPAAQSRAGGARAFLGERPRDAPLDGRSNGLPGGFHDDDSTHPTGSHAARLDLAAAPLAAGGAARRPRRHGRRDPAAGPARRDGPRLAAGRGEALLERLRQGVVGRGVRLAREGHRAAAHHDLKARPDPHAEGREQVGPRDRGPLQRGARRREVLDGAPRAVVRHLPRRREAPQRRDPPGDRRRPAQARQDGVRLGHDPAALDRRGRRGAADQEDALELRRRLRARHE